MKKLRFAALVRVSGEVQAKKGESLRTQRTQLEADIKTLGGTAHRWYAGQEHATVDEERRILDRLLEDAQKDRFDAVICTDQSRWARDNVKNMKGLDILRDSGVRFFLRTKAWDLYNPQHRLYLALAGVVNEYVALEQTQKSMDNKIEIALKGGYAAGNLPYGRTFDRKKYEQGANPKDCWGVDPERKKAVEWAITKYLDGTSIRELAPQMPPYNSDREDCKKHGMSDVALTRLFRERLDNKWTIPFKSKRLNIDREITIDIPPLIDDSRLIRKVRERLEYNKRYNKSKVYTNRYLLSGMIYCADCGTTLTGQVQKGRRYYRHRKGTGACHPLPFCHINAYEIETMIWVELGSTFDSAARFEEAVKAALPDAKELKRLKEDVDSCRRKLRELEKGLYNLASAVAEGTLSGQTVKMKEAELLKQKSVYEERLKEATRRLNTIPDADSIKAMRVSIGARLFDAWEGSFNTMEDPIPFERKRKTLERLLMGEGYSRPKAGVYVKGERVNKKRSRLVSWEIVTALRPDELWEEGYKLLKKYKDKKGLFQAFLYDQRSWAGDRAGPIYLL